MRINIRSHSILLLYFLYHINAFKACPLVLDLETKARHSQAIIVAKILGFNNTTGNNRAVIQIIQIIKPPNSSLINFTLNKSSPIHVEGFQRCVNEPCSDTYNNSMDCISNVEVEQNYVLFINHTMNRMLHFYESVQLAELYSDSESSRIAAIRCGNRDCAPPNARAKKDQQATRGATRYTLTCRSTGNPPPTIQWSKSRHMLSNNMKGIKIKQNKRRSVETYSTSTLRIKGISESSAGLYRCIASNFLGNDTAKIKLSVRPIPPDSYFTPNPHYVPCPFEFTGHCLNGGLCLMTSSFSNLHCSCPPRYTGIRCEEIKATPYIDETREPSESPINLVSIVIILACSLAVTILLLLIAVCTLASWCHKRHPPEKKKSEKKIESTHTCPCETRPLLTPRSILDEVDRPQTHPKHPTTNHNNTGLSQTVETQTEDRLEGLFPHTSPHRSRRNQSIGIHQPSSSVSRNGRLRLSGISTPTSQGSTDPTAFRQTVSYRSSQVMSDNPSAQLAVEVPLHTELARKTYETPFQSEREPVSLHISEERLNGQPNGWGDTFKMNQIVDNKFVNGFSPKSAYDRYQD